MSDAVQASNQGEAIVGGGQPGASGIFAPQQSAPPQLRRRRRWKTALAGAGITAFWLAMMFTLVRDKILPQRREAALAANAITPEKLTQHWQDSEEFMAVKFGRQNVGNAATRVRRVMEGQVPGYIAEFRLNAGINLVGLSRAIVINARGDLDQNFNLSRFHITGDLAAMKLSATGQTTTDNELWVEVGQGDAVTRSRYQLGRQITLLDAVRPVATRNFEIKPGNSIAVPVVDPVMSMQHGTMEITVGEPEHIMLDGRQVRAFPLETRLNDFVTKSWVDEEGKTLRRQLVGEFFLERTTAERAGSLAAEMRKDIEIPRLEATDFTSLKPTPLNAMAGRGTSPLEALSSLKLR